MQNLILYK